jgi:hypothetical protein
MALSGASEPRRTTIDAPLENGRFRGRMTSALATVTVARFSPSV